VVVGSCRVFCSWLSLHSCVYGCGCVCVRAGEFQDEPAYDPADLTTFAKEVGITIAAPTKVGPFNPGADPESSLDIMVSWLEWSVRVGLLW
jgi:hypothetical protein